MKEWSSNRPWTSSLVEASIFASSSKRVFCIACLLSLTPASTIAKANLKFDSRSGSQAILRLYSAAHSSSSSARGVVCVFARASRRWRGARAVAVTRQTLARGPE